MKNIQIRICKLVLSLLCCFTLAYSQNSKTDSLIQVLGTATSDTTKVNILLQISDSYRPTNASLCLTYNDKALNLATKIQYEKGILRSLIRKSSTLDAAGDNEMALRELKKGEYILNGGKFNALRAEFEKRKGFILFKSKKYAEAIHSFSIADSLSQIDKLYLLSMESNYTIARIYAAQSQYVQAIKYCNRAIEWAEKNKAPRNIGDCYIVLGNIFLQQQNFDKSLSCYQKALSYFFEAQNQYVIAGAYLSIGNCYLYKLNYPKAKENYLLCLKIREQLNDELGTAYVSENIGDIEVADGNFDAAANYYYKGLTIAEKLKDPTLLAGTYNNLGHLELIRNNLDLAEKHSLKAIELAKKYGMRDFEFKSKNNLSKIYFEKGKYKEAYVYKDSSSVLKDTIVNQQQALFSMELEGKFQNEKKETEIKLQKLSIQNKDNEIQKKEQQKLVIIAILILAIVFSVVLWNRFRITRKQQVVILQQKQEVEVQKNKLQEKQKEILDSISYAKRLQQAILIPEKELSTHFTDCFILYKPKDIVSGDFYWFAESSQNKIIAVADCTGHGVPGGFMSMMGYEMLQDVLLKENITTTSDALKTLDKKMTDSLNRSNKNYRDGMDIALCAFDKKENQLQYTGANRPLLHISEGKLIEYPPDKNTIGGDIDGQNKTYNKNTIQFKKGDIFYLFTDGYADQFGGTNGKKFKFKQLKELLLTIHQESLAIQKQKLNETYEQWMGSLEQVDDVCIIGIRL